MKKGNKKQDFIAKIKKLSKDRTVQVIVITLVLSILVGTYAWFTSNRVELVNIQMGEACTLEITNTVGIGSLIPGNEIGGNISIRSIGDRGTFMRIQFDIHEDYPDFFQGTDTWDDIFTATLNDNFVQEGNWFYFRGEFAPEKQVDIFESLIANLTVGNEYQNNPFKIETVIECIQTNPDAVMDTWVMAEPDDDHMTEVQAKLLQYIPVEVITQSFWFSGGGSNPLRQTPTLVTSLGEVTPGWTFRGTAINAGVMRNVSIEILDGDNVVFRHDIPDSEVIQQPGEQGIKNWELDVNFIQATNDNNLYLRINDTSGTQGTTLFPATTVVMLPFNNITGTLGVNLRVVNAVDCGALVPGAGHGDEVDGAGFVWGSPCAVACQFAHSCLANIPQGNLILNHMKL